MRLVGWDGMGADKRKQEKGGIGKGKGDRETRTRTRDEGWGMVMGEWYCYKGGIYFLFVDPLSLRKMPRGVIDGDGKKERRRGVKKWGEI